ncbi:MAG: murein biosynthesis integral membrane protein MurJ, partial [Acidobacteria bacterium]|nr:murein biosynthesis integral membrane protein MurJ [Acidobacteriota bacterium]
AEAWRLGNQLLNALVVVTGAFVLAGMLFAEPLVRLLAGSYAEVPGKLELTVFLTRLLLPFLTLVAVAAALMGMLNSLNRFFVPALSPAMYNVGIILSGALLVPLMPGLGLDPIVAIAIGALLGGVGQVALQVPALHREGFRYRAALDPADSGLRHILRLLGPGTLAGAAVNINLLVNMVLATGQGTGAVSWLGYAFRVMYLPIGLFGVSLAAATLPVVSRHAAREEIDGIRDAVSRALRLMLVVNVPATVGLIALGAPVVQLIFERGSFTPEDTAATAAALLFYAPGLAGYSAVRIAVPCFYALGSSVTPTTISMAAVTLNIALNLLLVDLMGYRGLALGASIAALANAITLLAVLRRRLHGLDLGRVLTVFAKIAVASAAMGAAAWMTHALLLEAWPGAELVTRLGRVCASIAVGGAVLAAAALMLRIRELEQVGRQVLARLARNR